MLGVICVQFSQLVKIVQHRHTPHNIVQHKHSKTLTSAFER